MKNNLKKRNFPISVFLITLVVLLFLTSVQTIILAHAVDLSKIPGWYGKVIVCYWIFVSIAFTLLTRNQINQNFEKPIKRFAEAAEAVANGDFSVYVAPIHTAEKQNYLDVMFLNFNTMVEALGSIETLKTEFFSNVSHEIKTPLAIILNYAESLQKDNLSEADRRAYIDTIIQTSKRLSELITNILKLNKLEKQVIEPLNEPYDLCEQLCECAIRYEKIWEQKNIEFEADLEDRATIEADESLLELVWNNLLSNAVKFTEPGGTVTLRQTSTEDEITVSVTDTGCGMSEEIRKHIFDKFYQGDTSHSTEGNGLGLALALRIIQLTGGRITVDSELNVGSTFTVYLPIKIKNIRSELIE
jgi:Signal transduction histidine kinase